MSATDDVSTATDSSRSAIGLDVGGTKIAGGVVTESGRILYRRVIPTQPARGGDAVLADVVDLAREQSQSAGRLDQPPVAIGVGLCELVDPDGNVQSEQTIKWRDVPVVEELRGLFPTFLEADSRAAALCEARFGAGREFPTFLYVTVGTGIGCSLVLDGTPWVGARGSTGTMATSPHTFICSQCGAMTGGVLEEVASGPALVKRYNERAGSAERAEDVFAAAREGDADAKYVLESAAECLGATLGLLVNVFDPHGVVTGGGIGSTEGLYWRRFEQATRRHIWSESHRGLPILRAVYGEDAGLVGAALHGLERLERGNPASGSRAPG